MLVDTSCASKVDDLCEQFSKLPQLCDIGLDFTPVRKFYHEIANVRSEVSSNLLGKHVELFAKCEEYRKSCIVEHEARQFKSFHVGLLHALNLSNRLDINGEDICTIEFKVEVFKQHATCTLQSSDLLGIEALFLPVAPTPLNKNDEQLAEEHQCTINNTAEIRVAIVDDLCTLLPLSQHASAPLICDGEGEELTDRAVCAMLGLLSDSRQRRR